MLLNITQVTNHSKTQKSNLLELILRKSSENRQCELVALCIVEHLRNVDVMAFVKIRRKNDLQSKSVIKVSEV